MSLTQGYPNTFSPTQQTQEVLKNSDNETKKIYTDINAFMAVGGHAHTGNGSDGSPINSSNLVINSVINESLGANIASVATINLTTATGNFLHITGTTAITAVTLGAGMRREVIFDGILTLTHHATNNNLPGVVNITTAVGDRASYYSDGTTVYCTKYVKADGTPIAFSSGEILQLKIFNNATTPNTKMDITANNVPLYDTSYNQKKSGVISLTADLGASGANGLDTGSKANSTAYFLYVIGKADGTMASLWSLSATTPTMPTYYIYKRRVGWNKTDSSGNIYRLLQQGKCAQYVVTVSTNTPNYPVIASGVNGSAITPVWVAVSIGSFVPSTATKVKFLGADTTNGTMQAVAPNNSFTNSLGSNPPPYSCIPFTNGISLGEFILESTNVYIGSASIASKQLCVGWEDNL